MLDPGRRRRDAGSSEVVPARQAGHKQDCKAADEKTRAECRQMKRDAKQQGRNDGGEESAPATTNPAQ